jgi:hypothetical protein
MIGRGDIRVRRGAKRQGKEREKWKQKGGRGSREIRRIRIGGSEGREGAGE